MRQARVQAPGMVRTQDSVKPLSTLHCIPWRSSDARIADPALQTGAQRSLSTTLLICGETLWLLISEFLTTQKK